MKKSLLVKQRDSADCGAACLASVAAHYGLQLTVSRIRQYAGTDRRGTSLSGLIEAAELLQFQARGAKATGIPISSIPLPSIFHVVLENEMQHFVVVYKVKKNGVRYMDPAMGKYISRRIGVFKKQWSGVVLLLMPSENFQRGNKRTPVIRRFWQLIQPHRSFILQALLGALVYTILGLATSIYVQKIVDFVLPDANKYLMNLLSTAMILLLFFKIITGYVKSLIVLRTGQQIDSRLILGYYKHLLKLPQRFFDSMRVGEIISRVHDALRIRIFINDVALSLVVHVLTIILSLMTMFIYYWKLALIMLLVIPVYLLIYLISDRVNAKWQRKMMESGAALESQLVESVQGVSTIRRFGSEDYFNFKTEKKFIPLMRAIYYGSRNGLLLSGISEWVTSLITIVVLWAGSFLVIDRVLSPGELLSFYTLTGFFTTPVQALIGANKPMQDALIAADRLFEIIDLERDEENKEGLHLEKFPEGDLSFIDVHFSYVPMNPVFYGLQVRLPQNQITAIIGESGCGKSTLISLIQKLYPTDKGNIQIGGIDIQNISTSVLRKKIGAVPQHTDLFQGDFISNIALGDQEPDLERIFHICQRLGLDEFIDRLPARYHTIIREQGMNLSGGQKQRIGIARAIYRDPEILILDEATSALDPESEKKVHDTLHWFHSQHRTIILIAHRLTTIRQCETIVFLKAGRAAVRGKHEILLKEDKDYADWWSQNYI